jgi:hypothetical protein
MVAAMMKNLLATLALVALVTTARAASVEVAPFGERGGQTVYALALAGDIKPGDDRRVASLLGNALIEDRFPGFMMLSSNGGDTEASLGIARIAYEYGMPVLVRTKCLSGCAVVALSAWRGRLFIVESGAIGLHQAWVGENYAHAVPSLEATHRVARTLRAYGVPRSIVERMMRTPPHRITYVTDSELAAIGALVKRRP